MVAIAQSVGEPFSGALAEMAFGNRLLYTRSTCAQGKETSRYQIVHNKERQDRLHWVRILPVCIPSKIMECPSPHASHISYRNPIPRASQPHTGSPNTIMYRNYIAIFQRPYLGRSSSDWDAVKGIERKNE